MGNPCVRMLELASAHGAEVDVDRPVFPARAVFEDGHGVQALLLHVEPDAVGLLAVECVDEVEFAVAVATHDVCLSLSRSLQEHCTIPTFRLQMLFSILFGILHFHLELLF